MLFSIGVYATDIEGYDVLVHPDTTCAEHFTASTEYISAQQPHPMFEVGYRYRIPFFGVTPNNGLPLYCDTEMQPLISAFLYWKWLKIGYNIALKPINKGFNFAYNINMGRMHLAFSIAHIRNLRLVNESDYSQFIDFTDDETRLRAFRSTDWDINAEWVCNKRYALLSGYDYSYHRAQLKSQGSGIVGFTFGHNAFNKRNFDETEQADAVLATLPLEKAKINTLNLGAGYGHNFAFNGGRWVLGLLCVPYVAAGPASYTMNGEEKDAFDYGFRANGRVNLTYNYRFGGISLSGEYNGTFLKNSDFDYKREVGNIRLNHAFRLGEFGLKNCKVPGHKTMDRIQRILTGE